MREPGSLWREIPTVCSVNTGGPPGRCQPRGGHPDLLSLLELGQQQLRGAGPAPSYQGQGTCATLPRSWGPQINVFLKSSSLLLLVFSPTQPRICTVSLMITGRLSVTVLIRRVCKLDAPKKWHCHASVANAQDCFSPGLQQSFRKEMLSC